MAAKWGSKVEIDSSHRWCVGTDISRMMYRVTALPSYVSRQRPVRPMHKCLYLIPICWNQSLVQQFGNWESHAQVASLSSQISHSLAFEMELYELWHYPFSRSIDILVPVSNVRSQMEISLFALCLKSKLSPLPQRARASLSVCLSHGIRAEIKSDDWPRSLSGSSNAVQRSI